MGQLLKSIFLDILLSPITLFLYYTHTNNAYNISLYIQQNYP
jgi:hypothetical protein